MSELNELFSVLPEISQNRIRGTEVNKFAKIHLMLEVMFGDDFQRKTFSFLFVKKSLNYFSKKVNKLGLLLDLNIYRLGKLCRPVRPYSESYSGWQITRAVEYYRVAEI